MTLAVVAMVVAAFLAGVGAGRVKLPDKRGPVNIVGGHMVPWPGDEGWRLMHHWGSMTFELGGCRIFEQGLVTVDDVSIYDGRDGRRMFKAIREAKRETALTAATAKLTQITDGR